MAAKIKLTVFPLILFSLFSGILCHAEVKDTINIKRPKVALVLSGGGAKGFTYIGILKVLERERVPVDIVVGTSIGALVGGIYSMGYSASEIENIVRGQNWEKLLSDKVSRIYLSEIDREIDQRYLFSLPCEKKKGIRMPQSVVRGQNILNLLCGISGNSQLNADFSKFPRSYACVATNLETGEEVDIYNGFLPTAMYASMAVPGVFEPCERDGLLLADGGIVNNFPVDVAKKMGADVIIGLDIRDNYHDRESLKSMDKIFVNLTNFYSKYKDKENKSFCDLIIHPHLSSYNGASFSNKAIDSMIVIGERTAEGMVKQIRHLKKIYNLEDNNIVSKKLKMPEKWKICRIRFDGLCHSEEEEFINMLNFKLPGEYSYNEIRSGINRLYGQGVFDKIYFGMTDSKEGKILTLFAKKKEVRSINVGFDINTRDKVAILLNGEWKNYSKPINIISVNAEISNNPGIKFNFEREHKNCLPDVGLEIKAKEQNYDFYNEGEKLFDVNVFYSSVSLYSRRYLGDFWEWKTAVQEEYFHGDIFVKEAFLQNVFPTDNDNIWLTSVHTSLSFDNRNNFYFPDKGSFFSIKGELDAVSKDLNTLSPAFLLRSCHIFPVGNNTAILLKVNSRAIFSSDFSEIKSTFLGGDSYAGFFDYHIPFWGLTPFIMADRFVCIESADVRFNLFKNHYLSFIFNALQQGDDIYNINHSRAIYGVGLKYSIKTIIGPVELGLGYSGQNDGIMGSFNLGYWF
ncbi:MAG: patatin-like phospholipase family protein [Prolixibacteraceae bacterium]|nr:patatin-like phospholipase family protein [Prolixibacteraceae bacterium]